MQIHPLRIDIDLARFLLVGRELLARREYFLSVKNFLGSRDYFFFVREFSGQSRKVFVGPEILGSREFVSQVRIFWLVGN